MESISLKQLSHIFVVILSSHLTWNELTRQPLSYILEQKKTTTRSAALQRIWIFYHTNDSRRSLRCRVRIPKCPFCGCRICHTVGTFLMHSIDRFAPFYSALSRKNNKQLKNVSKCLMRGLASVFEEMNVWKAMRFLNGVNETKCKLMEKSLNKIGSKSE